MREDKKEKKKEISQALGSLVLPQLGTCVDYGAWARVAKLLKDNTLNVATTNKRQRLRDVLFASITHPEAKKLTEDIHCPFSLLEALGKFFGAPNALTNECIKALNQLQPPSNTLIMNTNCAIILKQIRAIKDGPGIEVWNDFLFEFQISKAFTREHAKIWEQELAENFAKTRTVGMGAAAAAGRGFAMANVLWDTANLPGPEDYDPTEIYNNVQNTSEWTDKRKLFFQKLQNLGIMHSIKTTASITSLVSAKSPLPVPPRPTGPSSNHHVSFITSGQIPNSSTPSYNTEHPSNTSPATAYSTNCPDQGEDYFAVTEQGQSSTVHQLLPNIPNPPTFADKDTLMVKKALDKHQMDGV